MTTIQKTIFTKFAAGSLFLLLLVIPVLSQAATQTLSYKPQTKQEMIAYLYGRISQLLEMQQAYGQTGSVSTPNQSLFDYVSVETHSATDVADTTAILRGEVILFGKATANAWFEYGQDSDFLDQRTNKVSIRSAYERAVRIQVRNLEPDERYYFRIVTEDKNKLVKYGPVYAFRTDESNE